MSQQRGARAMGKRGNAKKNELNAMIFTNLLGETVFLMAGMKQPELLNDPVLERMLFDSAMPRDTKG